MEKRMETNWQVELYELQSKLPVSLNNPHNSALCNPPYNHPLRSLD